MGAADESESQLVGAFSAWDWAVAFPSGYAGTKAPMLVSDWPYELLDNLMSPTTDSAMTQPIIAIIPAVDDDRVRTFGDHPFGSMSGTRAMGVDLSFVVSCWADERLGGGPTVKKLMGQVQGCVLANRNSLTAYRRLLCSGGHLVYEERPQLWRADLTITGDGVNAVS